MFIDREEVTLVMALMPVLVGCSSKETPVASIPTLPSSPTVSEAVTPNPTSTSQPAKLTETPTPEPTATPQIESPFPKNTAFSGDMQEVGRLGLRGRSIFYVTDYGALLWRYDITRTCDNKEKPAFNVHLIDPNNFNNKTAIGPGFDFTVRGITDISGLYFKDGTLRTNFKFKEFPPEKCPAVDLVSVGINQGTDPAALWREYNNNRAAIRLAPLASLPEVWEDIRGQCPTCLKTKGK